MRGDEDQQQRHETDEVIVVEVVGAVDEVDVGEAEAEQRRAGAVPGPERDPDPDDHPDQTAPA